jgi:outer membrane protein assembly factor BamB
MAVQLIRESRMRFLLAAVMLVAASCGTNEGDRSTAGTTVQTTAPVTSSSVLPSDAEMVRLDCEPGLLPALAAVDRATGTVMWTYCSAELAWREVRGATDDVVFIDSGTPDPSVPRLNPTRLHAVIAIDARNGTELWRLAVANQRLGWAQGPFAAGGVVAVEVDDGASSAIVGVDATTGAARWRVTAAQLDSMSTTDATTQTLPPVASAPPPPFKVGFAPIANTDEVVVLAGPNGLLALDRASGTPLWSNDIRLQDDSGVVVTRGPAAVDGTTVMVPTSRLVRDVVDPSTGQRSSVPADAALVAIDAATGATLWTGSRLDHPTAAEGYVVGYVHGDLGSARQVIVFDARTGKQLWIRPGAVSYGDLWAIGDGAVYVVNAPGIVAYALASGEERWHLTLAVGTTSLGEPQLVAGDSLVLLWDNLRLLSTDDGTIRWTLSRSVSPSTPLSSVGYNTASIFVSLNSQPWTD